MKIKRRFLRFNLFPVCAGPLLSGLIGGVHTEKSKLIKNIKTMIENYPYRNHYGDDELFLRDRIWPFMLYSGHVFTFHFKRSSDYRFKLANPFRGSCFEPTHQYCEKYKYFDLKNSDIAIIKDGEPLSEVHLAKGGTFKTPYFVENYFDNVEKAALCV